MGLFDNMKLRARLLALPVVAALTIAGAVGVATVLLKQQHSVSSAVVQEQIPVITGIMQAQRQLLSIKQQSYKIVSLRSMLGENNSTTARARDALVKQMVDFRGVLDQISAAAQQSKNQQLSALAATAAGHYEKYVHGLNGALDMLESSPDIAQGLIASSDDAYARIEQEMTDIVGLTNKDVVLAVDRASDRANNNMLLLAVVAAGSILLMIVMSMLIGRSILLKVALLQDTAQDLSQLEFGKSYHITGHDEIAGALASIAASISAVRGALGEISAASQQSAISIAEISDGNQDLSKRTEIAAQRLEQISVGVQRLHDTIKENADSAIDMVYLAQDAQQEAEKSGQTVQRAVKVMQDIDACAKQIQKIIVTIDAIAFQTNILSLNASVESARAGVHGRGFAVVAEAVRNLAAECATAANEIKALISTTVEHIGRGSVLVYQAGTSMDSIVAKSRELASAVAGISELSQNQSSDMAVLKKNIQDVDASTQQNATLVEQIAAASESLKFESSRLDQSVVKFKI